MIYNVYIPESASAAPGETLAEHAEYVPEGVAKWALVFGPFWLAFHRLWWPLAFYVPIALLAFGALSFGYNPAASLLASLPGLYLFLEGNNLRSRDLERRDYALAGIVEATSVETAQELFLASWREPDRSPPPPVPLRSPASTVTAAEDDLAFGLFPEGRS